MRILIIEDEEALARVIKEKFDKEGYESVIVEEGEEALSKARQFKPDVILLDLLLPQRNGFEILQDLKIDPELKTAPVIVLSNLDEDENIKRAILLGAADYFVKTQHPISEVVEKVRYVAERGR